MDGYKKWMVGWTGKNRKMVGCIEKIDRWLDGQEKKDGWRDIKKDGWLAGWLVGWIEKIDGWLEDIT